MSALPTALYDTAHIHQIEALALKQQGISLYSLMCRAGQAVFNVLQQEWPDATSITVMIGTGNNGRDGLVVARLAQAAGLAVKVYQVGQIKPEGLNETTALARKDWLGIGGVIEDFKGQGVTDGVIVDALLGTGVKGTLAAPFKQAIEWINQSHLPVLSIDMPSGLESDTGAASIAVHATKTVVFTVLKVGLMTGVASNYRGELWFDDLDISPEDYADIPPIAMRLVYEQLIEQLPMREPSAHKGTNGHVCVVGGGVPGMSGAVLLAGEAALRAGAGLVTIAASPEALPLLARGPMELMCHPIDTITTLGPLLERATVIVLGPGLGQTAWSQQVFDKALSTQKICVVDADALNLLAEHPQKRQNWILTPHPKEAARLLKTTVEAIQADRIAAIRALSAQYGGVVVLKGAGTLLMANGTTEQLMYVEEAGLPVLGTAGTGDVLAGVIGGLLAQGCSDLLAAQLGVSVHSNAAQIESAYGERGMLASDLFLHIRGLLSQSKSL